MDGKSDEKPFWSFNGKWTGVWERNRIRQEDDTTTAVENDCGRRFVFLNVFIVPIRFADDIFDNNNIGLLTIVLMIIWNWQKIEFYIDFTSLLAMLDFKY